MRRESKRRLTRARLVEAGLACFSEEGYERTTVEQITRRAGVAKGTFFNYFRSKGELLLQVGAVQEEWMLDQIARLRQTPDRPVAPAIIELMVATATRLPLSRLLLRAMFQASLQSPEESDAQVRHFARVGEALIPLCQRGQARGELTIRVSGYEMAALIIQTYSGTLLAWSLTSEPETLGDLTRRTFQCLFDGLRQSTPS